MKDASLTTLKIGKIKYINALPFYHNLCTQEPGQVEFFENYPTKINLALRNKKIHAGLISSLEYLNHQDDYLLLPGLGIGSRDFSGSVLLLSHEKIEGLDGETIALTRESLSSAVLLRILLKFKYKFQNRFVLTSQDGHSMLDKHRACLVIGDHALFFQPRSFVYKYDLSELWWNWVEKPFCFALWAVQKKVAKENPEELANFLVNLRGTVGRNLTDLEGLIKEALSMSFIDAAFPKVFGYLFNLIYGMDASMEEGLQLYFRLAHRLGFSPKPRKLEFFEPARSV